MKTLKRIICMLLAGVIISSATFEMTGCLGKSRNGAGSTGSDESSIPSSDVSSEISEKPKFTKEDAGFNGVTMGMSMDEVRAVLGEPTEAEKDDLMDWFWWVYDDTYYCSMYFEKIGESDEYVLGTIYIYEGDVQLNNGLHVGSSFDDVIGAYYDDGQKRDVDFDSAYDQNFYSGYYLYGDINDKIDPLQLAYVMSGEYALNGEKYYEDGIGYLYVDLDDEKEEDTYGYYWHLGFVLDHDTKEVEYISIYYDYDTINI